MTPTPAFSQSLHRHRPDDIGVGVMWTVKERDPKSGLFIPRLKRKNLLTSYGLTAHASAIGGGYLAPMYLSISQNSTNVQAQGNPGDTVIILVGNPTIAGDTQLVLSPNTASQETVTFTGVTGTGPYSFALSSALVNTHPIGDYAARQVNANDTMAQMAPEASYDPTYDTGNRPFRTAGYSPGTGQFTMQFYMSGLQATNVLFMTVGLTDQQSLAATNANLHNAVVLGFLHNTTNDLEIDVSVTEINN